MKRSTGFVVGILIAALGLAAGGMPNPALAQTWPGKPIRIVIAQAPGSATDVISRVVANQLSVSLGQPIVIDARPGAGGVLGTEVAARSAPDGYTLFMANNSTHGSNPAVYAKLPYDAVQDFAPVFGFAPTDPVQGTDLPGLDFVTLAAGMGCRGVAVKDASQLRGVLSDALQTAGPMLVETVVA